MNSSMIHRTLVVLEMESEGENSIKILVYSVKKTGFILLLMNTRTEHSKKPGCSGAGLEGHVGLMLFEN